MIKFFRKIRQQMLNENRFSKYLLYALGEIVLVVIGILIALQINNWNQNRLDENLEITMLKEIKNALDSDLIFFEEFKQRLDRKSQSIQELLKMTAANKVYPDSTLLKAYNQMIIGVLFDYNKGPYEALKSVGLDKISNDTLRNQLIGVYDIGLPTIKSFFLSAEENIMRKDYLQQLHNKLWKRIQIQLPNKNYKIVSRPINNEAFLKQTELIDRIKVEQDYLNYLKYRMPNLEYLLKSGLEVINKELGNRKTK